jgi:hypothetical protein
MKKENYLDYKTRSPDPDDLTSQQPRPPSAHWEVPAVGDPIRPELRPNPDASAPHVPPAT